MADNRSRREKLEAMAAQTASPHEAEIARRLLAEMETSPAASPRREAVEREADELVARMKFEYTGSGIRVTVPDGAARDANGIRPGVLGSMLREALRGERGPRL